MLKDNTKNKENTDSSHVTTSLSFLTPAHRRVPQKKIIINQQQKKIIDLQKRIRSPQKNITMPSLSKKTQNVRKRSVNVVDTFNPRSLNDNIVLTSSKIRGKMTPRPKECGS